MMNIGLQFFAHKKGLGLVDGDLLPVAAQTLEADHAAGGGEQRVIAAPTHIHTVTPFYPSAYVLEIGHQGTQRLNPPAAVTGAAAVNMKGGKTKAAGALRFLAQNMLTVGPLGPQALALGIGDVFQNRHRAVQLAQAKNLVQLHGFPGSDGRIYRCLYCETQAGK